ncbi:MAG: glycosyltransferase [Oscillatoria sp. SIO1A7]|nr:glycosyltransferase [Oscillatoria sp. SIO1A7]
MKDKPLISIVINNYNYDRFLREAIDSALNQTYPNNEIIVVDDGSTDDSRDIIASYGETIIPVLKDNGGQASAFNAGFAASTGDIVCLLDADDIFMPDKIAEVAGLFEGYPDIGWCFHPLRLVDMSAGKSFNISPEHSSRPCDFREAIKKGKPRFTPPATSGLCFSRSLLKLILPMPESILIASDNYLKLASLYLAKGFFDNRELACQRLHANNAYTLRQNNQSLKANVQILTAYWLRFNFPELEQFTNNAFAQGIGRYWRYMRLDADLMEIVRLYWSSVPTWLAKLEIVARCFYHSIR